MALHEVGCGLVCGEVLGLHESQGRAPTASRQDGAVGGSHLEMGRDHDGFYHDTTMDIVKGGYDLGYHGSIDQECIFHSYLGEHLCKEIGRCIYP